VAVKHESGLKTRDEILRLAIAAIEKGGESAVHVKDIADEANVAVTSIYHFFGSRDGLIVAAQSQRYVEGFVVATAEFGAAIRACNSRDEFRLLIRAVNAEVFIPARADVRAMRLNVIGSTQGRPELAKAIREIQEKSIRDLADAAKPAAERGWIPEESLFLAISAWHQSSVFGYGMLEVGGSVPEDLDWKHVYLKALEIMIFGDYLES
jgi:AcrR family transcriptional regulator